MAAGAVAFNKVPGDALVPFFFAELNAGPPAYSGNSKELVYGRTTAGASAQTRVAINTGNTDPNVIAGLGSMGAEMLLHARRRNPTGEIWFIDVGAPTGSPGTAVGAYTFAGTATAAGLQVLYIGGERYEVPVSAGMTAAQIATAFAAEVALGYAKFGRAMAAPVTAAVDGSVAEKVNLTARHSGVEGNWIDLETGLDGDEVAVPGITVTETAMAGGTGDVDMLTVLATLGEQAFDWHVSPYGSTAQLNGARDFLANRWNPVVGLQGHYITATEGNLSTLTSFGAGRNDPFTTVLGTNKYPHPRWQWVAALGSEIAFRKNLGRPLSTAIEIARPMQTLVLEGLRAPKVASDRFGVADRDSLYRSGITAVVFRDDGQVALDRVVTTYKRNDANLPDSTFRDIESVAIAAYFMRYMKQVLVGTYPRHVMKEDNPLSIQGVVTPEEARGTVIHAYARLDDAGIVRQTDLFTEYLVVQFDYENDRANFYMPVSKSAALRLFAANVTLFLNLTEQNASGL